MHFAKRATFYREVLSKYIHQASVYGAITGDYTFTRQFLFFHAEVGATVGNELVQFYEGSRVKQQVHAFPRGFLAAGVLFLDAFFSASS